LPAATDRTLPTLHGARVTLRPLTEADLPALAEMLLEPEAARWWGEHDAERLRKDYLSDDSTAVGFAIELDGELIGLVAYWEENEPDYRHAGMDITLAAEHRRQGLGADALRALGRHLLTERGHWRLTIDPAADNEQAIRCYEAVGFRPVGIVRRYERLPDGSFRDGLLMDMLADELR
jgi:aminoglycoside 6'-N-acetyltransferase